MTARPAKERPASGSTAASTGAAGDLPGSPCVRACDLDEAEVCIGCGLHVLEILAWGALDTAEREATLQRAAARHAARPPARPGPPGPE